MEPNDRTPDPERVAEFRKRLKEVLDTLTPREAKVISLRFGLTEDGKMLTFEEVGALLGVTRNRIKQIEAMALRKIRHPSRSRRLKGGETVPISWIRQGMLVPDKAAAIDFTDSFGYHSIGVVLPGEYEFSPLGPNKHAVRCLWGQLVVNGVPVKSTFKPAVIDPDGPIRVSTTTGAVYFITMGADTHGSYLER